MRLDRQVTAPDLPDAFKLASTIGTAILSAPSLLNGLRNSRAQSEALRGKSSTFRTLRVIAGRYREPSQNCSIRRQACTEKTQVASPE
jgi:hypothetical protein